MRYYRHPRTTAEKRANQDTEYARSKRNISNLVNAYDDIPVCHQKSWKKTRKKQYKVKAMQ